MTLQTADGDTLTKTALLAATTTEPTPEARFKLTEPVFETYTLSGEGTSNFQSGRRLKYKSGTVLSQSQVDALYPTGTAGTISPASGTAAGNTNITITGTNLSGVTGVTFGGAAASAVKVVSETKVTCKSPAHASGAVDVVIADDKAPITKVGAYTYS